MEDKRTCSDGDFSPGSSQSHRQRSNSVESNCVSMKSDRSMEQPVRFEEIDTSTDLRQRSNLLESSCVSMKNVRSMEPPAKFEERDTSTVLRQRSKSPESSCVSLKSDRSMKQPEKFEDRDTSTDLSYDAQVVQSTLKSNLIKKFQCLHKGTAKQGNPTLLNEIYTELYITESESGEINNEHESDVRLCDVSESASVDVLLMNLIAGNLLPSAQIWITSRPAAADLVPSECVHRVTEESCSIQEHLAALYVHLSFMNNTINVFETEQSPLSKGLKQKKNKPISELHQRAVDEALQSNNGHLELFLHFLLGLSVEFNQTLLQKLETQIGSCSYNKEETLQFIKEKITVNHSPERPINLFHCLNELGDDSLEKDYLKTKKLKQTKLSSLQW
ncbi:Protein NLRC3 [Anabarilius grahami]|uniref:Protein NLRC3 n=1 Tax=Anabarilius grahami TaxID=495550 RepID=A0A3N0Y843_ANAGA|nr:Protein NLRC3 [Anabarilius grahami]